MSFTGTKSVIDLTSDDVFTGTKRVIDLASDDVETDTKRIKTEMKQEKVVTKKSIRAEKNKLIKAELEIQKDEYIENGLMLENKKMERERAAKYTPKITGYKGFLEIYAGKMVMLTPMNLYDPCTTDSEIARSNYMYEKEQAEPQYDYVDTSTRKLSEGDLYGFVHKRLNIVEIYRVEKIASQAERRPHWTTHQDRRVAKLSSKRIACAYWSEMCGELYNLENIDPTKFWIQGTTIRDWNVNVPVFM